jgi:hypothetical protein
VCGGTIRPLENLRKADIRGHVSELPRPDTASAKFCQGRYPRREKAVVWPLKLMSRLSTVFVITREGGDPGLGDSTIKSRSNGVLDTALSRGMTVSFGPAEFSA